MEAYKQDSIWQMKLYNPEVEKAIAKIKDSKAKTVCVQLPDGMKPYAKELTDRIEEETGGAS